METTKGFVYIMINPSYGKEIVKIGKTTKEPEERAKELSSSTGVATPFIVVYKRAFKNCHIAEKIAHEILESRGCRVNSSREFFAISIPDAINIILQLPNDAEEEFAEDEYSAEECSNDDLAEEFYEMGDEYAYGSENTFQDIDKAIACYERSANLGKTEALHSLGMVWYYDKSNAEKALQYFHLATDKGCWISYRYLAYIYGNKELRCYNPTNRDLAWQKYFESIKINNSSLSTRDWTIGDIGSSFIDYLYEILSNRKSVPTLIDELIYLNKDLLKIAFTNKIKFLNDNDCTVLVEPYKRHVKKYINKIEEKILLSPSAGEDLAENYITIANKYFWGESGYRKNTYKALKYYEESKKLGCERASIYIGQYWLTEHKQEDKVISAWNDFYNSVYDKTRNNSIEISKDENRKILECFYLIFTIALSNNASHLIHKYYTMMALHLGITDYIKERAEELQKLPNGISNHEEESYKHIKDSFTKELLVNAQNSIEELSISIFKAESEHLKAVINYLAPKITQLKEITDKEKLTIYRIATTPQKEPKLGGLKKIYNFFRSGKSKN